MDERLDKAIEFANYRQTLSVQLQKAKIKTAGLLMLSKNGGSFVVNQELISFLDYLSRKGIKQSTLMDSNSLPIKIDDITTFLEEVTSRYFEVTNDYLREYETIRKSRNVRSILDLKDEK